MGCQVLGSGSDFRRWRLPLVLLRVVAARLFIQASKQASNHPSIHPTIQPSSCLMK
jgi:hypothetical protein